MAELQNLIADMQHEENLLFDSEGDLIDSKAIKKRDNGGINDNSDANSAVVLWDKL